MMIKRMGAASPSYNTGNATAIQARMTSLRNHSMVNPQGKSR